MQIFLVHGEYSAQQVLAALIKERFGFNVIIPDYLEETILKAGEALQQVKYPDQATPRINWNYLLDELQAKVARLREQQARIEDKPWMEQTDLRDRILEINRGITEVITET
jgi:metallo-beta-lactamase family protein